MRPIAACIIAMALSSTPWPAGAQPAYTAGDIVRHFAPAAGALASGGQGRALCVGTAAECQGGQPAPGPRPGAATATTAAPQSAPSAAAVPPPAPAAFDLVVTFDYDSDVLRPEARANLDQFAAALKDPALRALTFAVDGHTDAKGSAAYNMALSERRAASVVRYLDQKGIAAERLVARGFGQTQPRIPHNPFDPANRRVETRVATR